MNRDYSDYNDVAEEESVIDENENVSLSNCCDRFLDILLANKKLPCDNIMSVLYKIGLLVYYLANFVFSIVFVVNQDHQLYHFIYIFISLVGFIYEVIIIIVDKRCSFR